MMKEFVGSIKLALGLVLTACLIAGGLSILRKSHIQMRDAGNTGACMVEEEFCSDGGASE